MSLHAPGRFSETEFCGADSTEIVKKTLPTGSLSRKQAKSKMKGVTEEGPEILATLGPQCLNVSLRL